MPPGLAINIDRSLYVAWAQLMVHLALKFLDLLLVAMKIQRILAKTRPDQEECQKSCNVVQNYALPNYWFKMSQILSHRHHSALNRGAFGGVGKARRGWGWELRQGLCRC